MQLHEALLASRPEAPQIAWGSIISTSPLAVRFAGDTSDTSIDLWLASYTPVTNDRVMLMKVGSQWVIVGEVVNA